MKLSTVQRANEIAGAHVLSTYRLKEMRETLAGTTWADKVPTSIDFSKPGVETAVQRFQRYVSHSNQHGMDVYESLQTMGSDRRDQKTGRMMPNRDAAFVDTVAAAMGGWNLLKQVHDKLQADSAAQKASAEARARGDEEVATARKMIPVKAAAAGAEEAARVAANPQLNDAALTAPDVLGFRPNVPGGLREFNKRLGTFKKNLDDLSKSEATFQQFQAIRKDIAAGKFSGAESVVGLFDAIGISATPLAGRGFRVNNNVIQEHEHARGWMGSLQQKLLSVKDGDVITPHQLLDYANIASQARQAQYINLVNQLHNAGLPADAALPTGNGQVIDKSTAGIFIQLSGNDFNKAAAAMKAKGWIIP